MRRASCRRAVGSSIVGPVVALDGLGAGAELGHGRTEGAEVVDHGLVDQDVAVGQEQDAFLAPGLPQPPDDLKGGVGLAGAGGHDQQDAVLALGDGLDRRVDGVALVVARLLAAAVVVVGLQDDRLLRGREALPGAVSVPERFQGWGRRPGRASVSIWALWPVRSWKTKPSPLLEKTKGTSRVSGVVEGLLHAGADGVVVVLGLDQGDGDALVVEDVVGALGLAAGHQLAAHDDAALGEGDLAADLGGLVPPSCDDGRRDVLGADVVFAERLLVHTGMGFPGEFRVRGGAGPG